MLTEFRPLRVRRKDRLVDPTTVLNNCWVPDQLKARQDLAELSWAWEPYSYRASSTARAHSRLRQSPRRGRAWAWTVCLTLNDIQNSLQLILFRMHKYKQMGMPGCISSPLYSTADQTRPSQARPDSRCHRISEQASVGHTRNNNLANWPILA